MRRPDSVVMLILIPATWLAPFSNFQDALSCYSWCNLTNLLPRMNVSKTVRVTSIENAGQCCFVRQETG
jgi:hypothetical protein